MTKAVQVVIRGRVQGVGYRAWLQREAVAAGLSGWVRNRSAGTVEALLAGPAAAIDAVVALCRGGPPGAMVSGVVVQPAVGPEGAGVGFRVLPTV